jgi:circadian clock protein KaiB
MNAAAGSGYSFRLFVASNTERSEAAEANLRYLCESYLPGQYQLEIIDVVERPDLAEQERILVTPTVIRAAPSPQRRVIGDLSDHGRAGAALGLPIRIAGGPPQVGPVGKGDQDE